MSIYKEVYIYKNGQWSSVCSCQVKTYFQNNWVDIDYGNVEKDNYININNNGTTNNVWNLVDCLNGRWIKWGYLYNFYAQQDSRNIANPTNGWRLPNDSDLQSLTISSGTYPKNIRATGYYSKVSPIIKNGYFSSVSDGNEKVSDNDFHFTAIPLVAIKLDTSTLGSASNANSNGLFAIPINQKYISLTTNIEKPYYYLAKWSNESNGVYKSTPTGDSSDLKMMDYSHVRLCRDLVSGESALADGTYVSDYVGNDSKTYKAVKIKNKVWMAEYLCETQYANGNGIIQQTTKTQVENQAWINTSNIGIDSNLWSKNPYCIPNWFTLYNTEFTNSYWFTNDIKFYIETQI